MGITGIHASIGISTASDYLTATKEALQQARASFGANSVDLALLFTTIEYAHPNTADGIFAVLNPAPVIGCSTAALLTPQGIHTHGIALVLLKFSESISFRSAHTTSLARNTPLLAGEDLGENLLREFHGTRECAVILCDGSISDGSHFVAGIQERLGISFPVFGGCASDNLRFMRTYLYRNQHMHPDAAVGLLLGGSLRFGAGTRHGWKPIGKPRIVTRAQDNIIYEIDNVSATNMYEDYFACDLTTLRNNRTHIAAMYPVGIHLEGEAELLLRTVRTFNDNGSLTCQGTVPQGSTIRLMIGTKESALEATRVAAQEARAQLGAATPQFVLVFESVSRYMLLGRQMQQEMNTLQGIFPGTPLLGVCTFGEIAPLHSFGLKGKTYFHNQTVSLLALGE